ncbi:KN motif and ankyrin repeat domain-containing protein 2 [Culicoides brevitarsis]|uniref:KN motif and ankyrin repeat domain-containing protein 2 n=1 Tax=Culicoides brevitarsis TaxID=469753 RepID=UPI00307CA6D2
MKMRNGMENGISHKIALNKVLPDAPIPPNNAKYKSCYCCPFGFHIDLDFVKYCEELSNSAVQSNGTRSIRRDRRRQRESMEVMLGIDDTWISSNGTSLVNEIIPESDSETPIAPRRQERERDWVSQINDIPINGFHKGTNGYDTTDKKLYPLKQTPSFLEDVCDDFERTLERSKTKTTRQVQIADAVDYYSYSNSSSGGSVASSQVDNLRETHRLNSLNNELQLEHEIDTASEISCGSEVSKAALHAIREQMALSLARMKDLEDQVKLIPNLQNQLVTLKKEKQQLHTELRKAEETYQRQLQEQLEQQEKSFRSASKSTSPPTTTTSGIFTPQRVSPVSLSSLNDHIKTTQATKQQRSTGTQGTPITRDVGCSPPPVTKTYSTGVYTDISIAPTEKIYTKRDLEASLKEQKHKQDLDRLRKSISVGVQISDGRSCSSSRQTGTQTVPLIDAIQKTTIAVMCRPEQRDVSVSYAPQLRSVGISDHTIDAPKCEKCDIRKFSVAVGPDTVAEVKPSLPGISLKALDQRSLSFSLAENEKLKIRRKHAGVQVSSAMSNAAIQHSPLLVTKQVQYSPDTITQQTDTKGLIDTKNNFTLTDHRLHKSKESATNTEVIRTRENGTNVKIHEKTSDFGTNTEKIHKKDASCGELTSVQQQKGHIQIVCAENYCDSCKDSIKSLAKEFAKATEKPPMTLSLTKSNVMTTSTESMIANERKTTESKIPKPALTTPSPTAQRKFVRQNTYTVDSPSVEKSFIPFERKSTFTIKTPEPVKKTFGLSLSSLKSPPSSSTQSTSTSQSSLTTVIAREDAEAVALEQTQIPTPTEIAETESEIAFLKRQTCDLFSTIEKESSPIRGLTPIMRTTTTTGEINSPCPVHLHTGKDFDEDDVKVETPEGEKGNVSPVFEQSEEDEERRGNIRSPSMEEITQPRSAEALYNQIMQSSTERKKAVPSKEMQAALKVINDSLQKSSGAASNLKSANKIVQKEWFQISSTDSADPLDVEDYLDCFDEYSSDLLSYMVNYVDGNGNTAMHYAVSHGNFDVVSILLDSKVCNVNQTNNAGYTCVMLVSLAKLKSSEHRTVVQRLFQLSDVNIRAKKHNQTALMLAVSHGNLEMVKMLLEAGADINIQDDDGSTALMCAAEHGRIDIVKLLLAQPDCDSTIQDIDGSTALKISLEAGYRDIGVLLYAHEHMSRNKSPYASLRRKKERTISGGSNGGGAGNNYRSSSARTSPLPSPKLPMKKEPFRN